MHHGGGVTLGLWVLISAMLRDCTSSKSWSSQWVSMLGLSVHGRGRAFGDVNDVGNDLFGYWVFLVPARFVGLSQPVLEFHGALLCLILLFYQVERVDVSRNHGRPKSCLRLISGNFTESF